MMYLIIGRTGSGKDYLAQQLCDHGLKQVKSYTTRKRRTPDEDTHRFITMEEASKLTDRVAETAINGNLYFATREQVKEADVYIIDPNGLYQLVKRMPEEKFSIIYVHADAMEREKRALSRVQPEDYSKEVRIYESRCCDEDGQFTEFEQKLKQINGRSARSNSLGFLDSTNVLDICIYENKYNPEETADFVDGIVAAKVKIDKQIKGGRI